MTRRHVVLGLVSTAALWPRRVDAWSSSGTVPVTVKFCPSVEHLHALLRSGQRRAVLLDGDLPMVDRDLLAAVTAAGGIALIVEGTRRRREWDQLGAAAVLPSTFDERQFLDAINPHAGSEVPARTTGTHAPLVAVTGPGGTGVSVTAIALAQGFAASRPRVVLVDCCLHAEQSMLHNAHGAQPGLMELVELHAAGAPSVRQIRQLTIGIVERGYHLLVGLRRARHWSTLRQASLLATLQSMRSAFDVVVADVDADVDGEEQTGSVEVEERNSLARTVVSHADLVLVIGQPSMKGVYALVRTIMDLLEFGVAPRRLLPVVNRASGAAGARAELSRAVRQLISDVAGGSAVSPPLFLPDLPLENELRDRDALPQALPRALATAVDAVLARDGVTAAPDVPEPRRIPPGTMGHWSGERS